MGNTIEKVGYVAGVRTALALLFTLTHWNVCHVWKLNLFKYVACSSILLGSCRVEVSLHQVTNARTFSINCYWTVMPYGIWSSSKQSFTTGQPGLPCRRAPELDPGRGRGMGALAPEWERERGWSYPLKCCQVDNQPTHTHLG